MTGDTSLEALHVKIDDLIKSSKEHYRMGHVAAKQIGDIHEFVGDVRKDTMYLNELPRIRGGIEELNGKAFDAAMGRRQIPIDIFIIVVLISSLRELIAFFKNSGAPEALQYIAIGTVCLLCVILVIGRGSFRASTSGVEYKKDT